MLDILHSQEPILRDLAHYIYEKIYKNYTAKQWASALMKSHRRLLPECLFITDYDNRYFTDAYQAIPEDAQYGYDSINAVPSEY